MGRVVLNEVQARANFKLVESKEAEPGVLATVQGPFAQFGVRNRNERLYEKPVWDHALSDPDVVADLKGRRMFGELDHPEDYLDIKIDKTAFCVTNLAIDESDNTIQGEIKVLDTPAGKILNTLLRFGSVLGVSSRASGELDESNRVIPESFRFITFDIVTNPSNVVAFPKLTESVDNSETRPSLLEAIASCVATADKTQLLLIRDIAKSMEEESAADLIHKVEIREEELDDKGDDQDRSEGDDITLAMLNAKLDEILDLLKVKNVPAEEPPVPEDIPENTDNKPRVRMPIRAQKRVVESTRRETTVSVSRLAEATEGDRMTQIVQANKTK